MLQKGINNNYGGANFIFSIENGFLIIVDLDIFKERISVTLDIHNVLRSIADQGYNLYKYKIIYIDGDALFDAILVNQDNSFKAFAPLGYATKENAMLCYTALIQDQELK